jgi:hypothetical protein
MPRSRATGVHGVARLARVLRRSRKPRPQDRQALSRRDRRRIFRDPAFERIELNVYTFNHAAIAVYRSLGFVQEGNRRSAVRVGAERWDSAIFGLLRSEYAPHPVRSSIRRLIRRGGRCSRSINPSGAMS